MGVFKSYLEDINNLDQRFKTEEVLNWVISKYSDLEPKIAWNQPMFTIQNTFIIGFSVAQDHLAIAPEKSAINNFSDEIVNSGYEYSKNLIKIPWKKAVDYSLLENIIEFNVLDKSDTTTFWRK